MSVTATMWIQYTGKKKELNLTRSELGSEYFFSPSSSFVCQVALQDAAWMLSEAPTIFKAVSPPGILPIEEEQNEPVPPPYEEPAKVEPPPKKKAGRPKK